MQYCNKLLLQCLCFMYGKHIFRKFLLRVIVRIEGGEFYSSTLRDILKRNHGVIVGEYSYGECLKVGGFPSGVVVGRYVSIAAGVKVFLRNHPVGHLSMHPFFYNSALGVVESDRVQFSALVIEDDAWIGENALITPSCNSIGFGAVVGAGSVVTKDVADFSIVAGNPAKVIGWRFDESERLKIVGSEWWKSDISELSKYRNVFTSKFSRKDIDELFE